MAVTWEKNPRLPRGAAASLAALQFSSPRPELLAELSDAAWNTTLAFTDHAGLTLILGVNCSDYFPSWVRERVGLNLARNSERAQRWKATFAEIATQFERHEIEYLLLKGFFHETGYISDPRLRISCDIDLFTPRDSLFRAREALCALGYGGIGTAKAPASLHLPSMHRKTAWQWSGDFFDPDIPVPVDLHFEFWDALTERIAAPGTDQYWSRRIICDGTPILHPVDRLGFAALHLLRHLLHGTVRAYHVYEIARFLNSQAEDETFWDSWREMHPEPTRRLEAVSFRLAAEWFGCRVADQVREEIDRFSDDVSWWFERYVTSPMEANFCPGKDELWLHLSLLASARDRRRVFLRRAFPTTAPQQAAASHVNPHRMTWRLRARKFFRYSLHATVRVRHHVRALLPVVTHGLVWKSRTWRLQAPFWRFLACATFFNYGAFVFLLLYNLYLLDLGYRENVLGLIASAFTAGNLVGVLPAAALAHRWGLKRTLLACLAGTALVLLLRALVAGQPALIAAAFAHGLMFSIWAVCMSPVIAAVTTESARPTGFSIAFGSGIGLGVLAGLIGGRMPGWVTRAGWAASPAQSKQIVLFTACASVVLAFWPVLRLRLDSPAPHETRSYPSGSFIRRFLVAIGVWGFAVGLFNPLFNAYFARQFRMSVERIGTTFSIAQATEVVAMMAAPFVLRRLGLTRGVALMQLASAIALALLAPAPVALVAVALYTAFASFQYMSEPGIYSELMNCVPSGQRSGASALNFLVLFGGQALAAAISGAIVARCGYPPMLAAASVLAAFGAWLFWHLPQESR